MRILLISGHAGTPYDPGATATIDGVYYEEAKLNIEVLDRVEKLLREKYGQNVSVYDLARDAYKDWKNGQLSFGKYDYLLEIHFNACVKDYNGNGYTTGCEIYWPSRGKPTGAEEDILKHVCALGLKNRGAMAKGLAVINTAAGCGIPANLLEVCFIDDADDMRIYLRNKDKFAEAIAAGVAEAFGLKETAPTPPADPWWIKDGTWQRAKELGFMDGTRPTDDVTRAELAAVAVREHDKTLAECKKMIKEATWK